MKSDLKHLSTRILEEDEEEDGPRNLTPDKRIEVMILKSKKELLENKLMFSCKKEESEKLNRFRSELSSIIEKLISFKYYLLLKKCELTERNARDVKELRDKMTKSKEVTKKEMEVISKFDKRLGKRHLKLLIEKHNREKFGRVWKIEILPDTTLPARYAQGENIYYS